MTRSKLRPHRLYWCWLLYKNLPLTRFFSLKRLLLRWSGATLAEDVSIESSARIAFNGFLAIGSATYVGHECLFTGGVNSEIILGKNCDVAPRVSFVAGSHEIDPNGPRVAGKAISESIIVGDGVWFGVAATILGGAKIGNNCIVAPGAVVRGTFPAKCLIGGVPAKLIRSL